MREEGEREGGREGGREEYLNNTFTERSVVLVWDPSVETDFRRT